MWHCGAHAAQAPIPDGCGEINRGVGFSLPTLRIRTSTEFTRNTSSTPTFLASGYSGPVDVVGIFSNANDFYIADDVTYGGGVAATPEPATLLLLGTTLAGAGRAG
jgi:hypothetical protein